MYAEKTAIIENCFNYGDVRCIVVDATPGAYHIIGGLVARLQGPTIFRNCVNYGHLDGKGMKDSNLGGIVANSADANGRVTKANVWFAEQAGKDVSDKDTNTTTIEDCVLKVVYENCMNFGLVENGRRIGGLVGTVEAQSMFTGCVNYGTVISGVCAQSDTDAGGIAGFHDQNPVEFYNCANFGKVIGGTSSAGGILGYSRNNKYGTVPKKNEVVVGECFNFGDITLKDGSAVGGILGNMQTVVTVAGAVNVGQIEATATGRVGQILGNAANTLTLYDCYLFGTLAEDSMPANYDGILEVLCSATITVPEGETMATIIGTDADITDARNAAVSMDEAYAMIVELFGDNAPIYKGETGLVFAYVALRGAQFSTEVADDKADLRFVGKAVNVENATAVQFTYKVGDAAAVTVDGVQMDAVYTVNAFGTSSTKTADTIGGDVMYAFVIEDVAVVGEVTIEVTMVVTAGDVTYTSDTVAITFVDGIAQ